MPFWIRISTSSGQRRKLQLSQARLVLGGAGPAVQAMDFNVGEQLPPGPQVAVVLASDERVLFQLCGSIGATCLDGRTARPGESLSLTPGDVARLGPGLSISLHEGRLEDHLSPRQLALGAAAGGTLLLVLWASSGGMGPAAPVEQLAALSQPAWLGPLVTERARSALLAERHGDCASARALYQAAATDATDGALQDLIDKGLARCRRQQAERSDGSSATSAPPTTK